MRSPQELLDAYADGTPYAELARDFLEFERWTGDDPVLLLAEAAASTTGQRYVSGIRPTVERFRDAFVETGRVTSYAELADVDLEDDDLIEAFGAQRKRRVFLDAAAVLGDRSAGDDLAALTGWAAAADPYRYRDDPIGAISGVGPSSFQYLRMLAGVDTAKPDSELVRLAETIADANDELIFDSSDPLRALAACEWLAATTSYRTIEIDRVAWWTFTDEDQRDAVLELEGSGGELSE